MTKQINKNSYDYDAEIVPIFADDWFNDEKEPSKLDEYRVKLLEGVEPNCCSSIDLTSFANK